MYQKHFNFTIPNTKLLFCYPHLYLSSMTKGGTMYNLKIKYKKILEHKQNKQNIQQKQEHRTEVFFCRV